MFTGFNPLFTWNHTRIPHQSERPQPKPFTYIFEGKDDENVFQKMGVYSKYAGKFVIFGSAYDILFMSRPKTIGHGIQRILVLAVPVFGAGLSYLAFAAVAASLRKSQHRKDHPDNHIWGGIAAAVAMTGYHNCLRPMIPWTIFFTILGYHWKMAIKDGYDLNPPLPSVGNQGYSMSRKLNTSMVAERPSNWYRDDPSEIQKRVEGFYAR